MVLLVACITTIAVPLLCYAEHGVADNCAVCQLKTESMVAPATYELTVDADCSGALPEQLSVRRTNRPGSVIPPRGPPRA